MWNGEVQRESSDMGRKSGLQQIAALQGSSATLPHGKKIPDFPSPGNPAFCLSAGAAKPAALDHTQAQLLGPCKGCGAPSWKEL